MRARLHTWMKANVFLPQTLLGVVSMGAGLGIAARPDVGAAAFITLRLGVPAWFMALWLLIAGGMLIYWRLRTHRMVTDSMFIMLSAPYGIFASASVILVITQAANSYAPALVYPAFWLLALVTHPWTR